MNNDTSIAVNDELSNIDKKIGINLDNVLNDNNTVMTRAFGNMNQIRRLGIKSTRKMPYRLTKFIEHNNLMCIAVLEMEKKRPLTISGSVIYLDESEQTDAKGNPVTNVGLAYTCHHANGAGATKLNNILNYVTYIYKQILYNM